MKDNYYQPEYRIKEIRRIASSSFIVERRMDFYSDWTTLESLTNINDARIFARSYKKNSGYHVFYHSIEEPIPPGDE